MPVTSLYAWSLDEDWSALRFRKMVNLVNLIRGKDSVMKF